MRPEDVVPGQAWMVVADVALVAFGLAAAAGFVAGWGWSRRRAS